MPFRHPSYYKSRSVEMPTRWPIIIKFRKKKKEDEEKRRRKKKEEEKEELKNRYYSINNIYHSNAVLIPYISTIALSNRNSYNLII